MKGIDAPRPIILEAGITRKISVQIRNSSLAFIENRAIENRGPFDVEHDFRQALGCFEETVRLKTGDSG